MGVFNRIETDIHCPNCNSKLEWQSKFMKKDGYPLANALLHIQLDRTFSGDMHTSCDSCNAWLEASIQDGNITITENSKAQ